MIIFDTHIWLYYINDGPEKLPATVQNAILQSDILGVSVISCWEIAMLVARKRLLFSIDVQDWITQSLRYKGVKLIDLTPEIAVLATRLPGEFQKDPADQIIAASCIKFGAPLVTFDQNIINWGYVQTIS